LKLKIALLVFLACFASAIATVAIAFSLPSPNVSSPKQIVLYKAAFRIQPTGDPIDNPFGPTT